MIVCTISNPKRGEIVKRDFALYEHRKMLLRWHIAVGR